jgi:hypothetical protein
MLRGVCLLLVKLSSADLAGGVPTGGPVVNFPARPDATFFAEWGSN